MTFWQGNVDKVVVIIKDKDHVALERFLFAVENMVNVDASERDLRCVGMLIRYDRSISCLRRV